ncbi:proprotein convertase P-domain-containing protein, partial [Lysobacter sp. 2RAB21]
MNVYQGARDIRIAASGGTGTYDLYVKLGEAPTTTSYTCRSTGAGAKSCVIASAPNGGKVYVLLKGSYSGVSLVGSFTYPSDITKIERLAIPDAGEATSTLSVSQSPSGDKIKYFASVSVNIDHTFIGDLKVDLISPTGKVQTVHNRTGGSTDNLRLVDVPVNMLGEPTNGNWKLRMSDGKLQDTGALTRWELKYH